jgi:hypothetical protein
MSLEIPMDDEYIARLPLRGAFSHGAVDVSEANLRYLVDEGLLLQFDTVDGHELYTVDTQKRDIIRDAVTIETVLAPCGHRGCHKEDGWYVCNECGGRFTENELFERIGATA